MSSHLSTSPRRSLNARQVETVERLFASASRLLDEVGHEELTIRMVASGAGVSPATAYTYFSSKEHLFAELFWRMLDAAPVSELDGGSATLRVHAVTDHLSRLITGSPALAAAVNRGLLSADPEVERLRRQIGQLWWDRFSEAVRDSAGSADPDLVLALTHALTGALLQAGVGIATYEGLGQTLRTTTAIIVRGND